MAINSLSFATKFADVLDKKLVQASVTSVFEDKSFVSKFSGAKTVKIPDIGFVGLGNYDRDSGFPNGAVSVVHTDYTLSKDRARTFKIDREDMDETGIANLAGQVMSEFVRTEVAPEVDAYGLSKLYGIAADTTGSRTAHTVSLGTGKTIANSAYSLFSEILGKVNNENGFTDEEVFVFVDPTVYSALMATAEINRHISIDTFKKGEIETKIRRIDNGIIIPVSAPRMKSAYTFNAGATASAGGFEAASSATNIGILALPKSAAHLVKKTEKIRVFTPDVNQSADAYKFDYRLYYDMLVKKSQKDTIYAYSYSITGNSTPSGT